MEQWVCLNGRILSERDASIPISDRGFLFGEGIFTTIKVHDGRCIHLEDHLSRLKLQAQFLGISCHQKLNDMILLLMAKQLAFLGTWKLKIILTLSTTLLTLEPYMETESWEGNLVIYPNLFMSPLAHLKTLCYLSHLQAKHYAVERGYDDSLLLSTEGYILETSCSNIFWIEQGKCYIPDTSLPYLKGVTLKKTLEYLKWPAYEVKMKVAELPETANVFVASSLKGIKAIRSIGNVEYKVNRELESLLNLKQI